MTSKPVLRSSRALRLLIIAAGSVLVAACATQPPPAGANDPGFFHGLFHGFIIVFGFVASIFTDYRIYAYPNSGWWYDLGFLLGAMSFLGGGGAGACRRAG